MSVSFIKYNAPWHATFECTLEQMRFESDAGGEDYQRLMSISV